MGELTAALIEDLLVKQTQQIKQDNLKNLQLVQKAADKKLKKLEGKCLFLERKLRKNNIVLFGLSVDDTTSLAQLTLDKINALFGLNFTTDDINNIYQIGKGKERPIIVEFVSFLKKSKIFSCPQKLNALKDTGISLANDLCPEDRQTHSELRRHLKQIRSQGHEAKIVGFKLRVGEKLYTLDELNASKSDTESESGDDSESNEEGKSRTDGTKSVVVNKRQGKAKGRSYSESESKRKPVPSPTYCIAGSRRTKKLKH